VAQLEEKYKTPTFIYLLLFDDSKHTCLGDLIKMSGLDNVVNLLISEHENLASGNLDISHIPKVQQDAIIKLAIEKAQTLNLDEETRNLLYYSKDWGTLLSMAQEKINSPDVEIQKKGLRSLWPLVKSQQQIPTDLAIRMVELELEEHIEEYTSHEYRWKDLCAGLFFGNAKEKAKELGYKLFKEGNFEQGMNFMLAASYKPKKKELLESSKVAFFKGRLEDVLEFYKYRKIVPSPETARQIILAARNNDNKAIGKSVIDNIFKYLEDRKAPLTEDDYKEQGDLYFECRVHGDPHYALDYYKKAGNKITPEEFQKKGIKILNNESNRGEDQYKLAFEYLKFAGKANAVRIMKEKADSIVWKHVDDVKLIYNLINRKISRETAMIAVQAALSNNDYDGAAEFYIIAKLPQRANNLGYAALNRVNKNVDSGTSKNNNFKLIFEAKNIFEMTNDKNGVEIANAYEKTYARG
jgi:hypothetical protein